MIRSAIRRSPLPTPSQSNMLWQAIIVTAEVCPVQVPKMAPRTHARAVELGEHAGPLRLVAFSDWRVQDISLLAEEIAKFPVKPDVVLYGGDDISRFREQGKNLFEDLARC